MMLPKKLKEWLHFGTALKYNDLKFRVTVFYDLNLKIKKKIQSKGVVMNPTILPTRKRNMLFAMPESFLL
jgi:hypothetical protein